MPGYSAWGERSNKHRAPLTPPDSDYAFRKNMVDQSRFSAVSSGFRADDGFNKSYNPLATYAPQLGLDARQQIPFPMHSTHEFGQFGSYMAPVPSARTYVNEANATVLPSIRPQEFNDPLNPYVPAKLPAPVEQKPKEEKTTGGVAAHLDYDINTMADFVAETSQGMYAIFQSGLCLKDIDLIRSVNSSTHVSAQYRTYVTQVLSSTRLPSSTIMLGLFYLASRMKIVSAQPLETRSSSTVHRMLTTCLLLGSKFLDDNTFQNRSWAEVSSIPVKELNTMELEWLFGFEWSIHGRMYDIHEGFFMWREQWLAYEDSRARKVKEAQKLTPLDTNIRRHNSLHKPLMSPEGPIPTQYQRSRHYDTQWVSPLISEPSPPSAAYSGPATPEYYGSNAWVYGQSSAFPSHMWNSAVAAPAYAPSRTQPTAYQQTASYMQPYPATKWGASMPSCGCTIYTKCKEHYFMQIDPYGLQPVAC